MRCLACGRGLTRKQAGPLEVDICDGGCGGIWFDNYELEKVDESHEHVGERLLSVEHDPVIQVDHERRRACPRCDGDVPMSRHFWSTKHEVEIDTCPSCGGTWLDTGELAGIRDAFPTEEARRAAAKQRFDELFGEDLERMRVESEDKARKARRFAYMLRFLCPSWYIPRKQDWGAF